ncbi:MAG: endonuclease/exonuclease/phosphatase family protein [Sandaracinus sp.]|nr:endonuclease/exonuclease/phosphatase family protein [Myxococcales bacterium]MCB9615589.1 endonuclease/exonuclease/phosphatase family protein [Sandaracinus sp.]MCB9631191.1 endonuclease/exonuclease/phosphatase family protein [Sandaracinus sp.]
MKRLLRSLAAILLAACGDDASPMDGSVETDAPLGVDAGPLEPTNFRVLTWNVQNFFDSVDDPDTGDDVLSSAAVTAKINSIARVLTTADADLVALQEVENVALLDRLIAAVPELGYTNRDLRDSFDGRGIDVAFMSRTPVSMVASHLGESFPNATGTDTYFFTRDALEVFTEPGGHPVTVMVVHFRSQLDGGDDRRLAEALQARRIADRRIATGVERMLIVGDCNDQPGSDVYDAIVAGGGMADLTLGVPVSDRWSFVFRGMRQQLDYAFANPALEEERTNVRILHGTDVDAASDHQPVVVDFRLTD